MSERAPISGSGDSKAISGRLHVFFFLFKLPTVRQRGKVLSVSVASDKTSSSAETFTAI